VPYDYGPFDSKLYIALDTASSDGLVEINRAARVRTYSLTPNGFARGSAALSAIPAPARTFVKDAASWVNSLSFSQLVSAIYQQYPDMKAKSVFRG
jgi:hypothetical protein